MAVAPAVLKITAALLVTALALLAGCAARSGPKQAAGDPAMDASYDWRGQVTVPFGTFLKSIPVPLHEVLLFHDEAVSLTPTAAATPRAAEPGVPTPGVDEDAKDCYAIDGTPPRLVGQTPSSYLLCFDHDRLNRIESTVRVPPGSAARVFSRACAAWHADTSPANPAVSVCEGHTEGTTFALHLLNEPGAPATLSLVLLNANPAP